MNMVQESIQNIKTPWELIIAIITVLLIALAYFIREEKKESKYHRDRADRVDEEAKKDRVEFQKERVESQKMLSSNQTIIEKMAETIHGMGGELKNKIDEVLRNQLRK